MIFHFSFFWKVAVCKFREMRCKRWWSPQPPQIKIWLTQDVDSEEVAPWVRLNITKSSFRPPTIFNYGDRDAHEHFDEETAAINKAFALNDALTKKRKAARRKEFWEIVHQIESADHITQNEKVSPRAEEQENKSEETLRTKYTRNARKPIQSFDQKVLEKLPEHIRGTITERLEEIFSLPT